MVTKRQTHTDKTKYVGIWIRVSTEDQAEGDSPEHHEYSARDFANKKGWEVREVYHLEAVSGKSVLGHPEAKRMLRDVERGHISALIFSTATRLARNTRQMLEIADHFKEAGADLISLGEDIDTSTPSGHFIFTMLSAFSEWERKEIAKRVSASAVTRAKLGKHTGGQAPYGYHWVDKNLQCHPQEAIVCKRLFELFAKHQRKRTVARLLNEEGHRARRGHFTDTTVGRILRDPASKGLRVCNYSTGNGKNWQYKPESEWIYHEVESIISEELWQECNAILDEQKKKNKRPTRKTVHLFSGLIFCGCGGKMYPKIEREKYICQNCRNKMPMGEMEEIFREKLKDFTCSPEDIQHHLDVADHVLHEKAELINTLQSKRQKLQRTIDKLYHLYIEDEIPKESLGKQLTPLEEQAQQIDEQLPTLHDELEFLTLQRRSSNQVLIEAEAIYQQWPRLTREEQRTIIENVTQQITIDNEDIIIDLYYLPTSSELTAKEQQNQMISLPFCHLRFTAEKSKGCPYPKILKSYGDHLLATRLDAGLTRKKLAEILGVTPSALMSWEHNESNPSIDLLPRIIDYLGYCLYEPAPTIGEKILRWRTTRGIRQEDCADRIGVSRPTLAGWETGKAQPRGMYLEKAERFLYRVLGDD